MTQRETKEQLLARLAEQQDELDDVRREVRAADRRAEEARVQNLPDAEAQAISECIKALDPLTPTSRGMMPSFSGHYPSPSPDEIARVLLFLANRYGVSLVVPPPEVTLTEIDVRQRIRTILAEIDQRLGP